MKTNRGMVLVTVLWVVLVISLVAFSLASAVRVEATTSQAAFDSERAFFMARSAAQVAYNAMARKSDIVSDSPVTLKNGEYIFPFETGEARVRLESNSDRIDLNAASDTLLASMFDSLGVDQRTRNELVDSMLDWRDADDIPHLYGAEGDSYPENAGNTTQAYRLPRNDSFQSVDELLSVKNMTRDLFYGSFIFDTVTGKYRRIPGVRDLVTVLSRTGTVDVNEASKDVLMALPHMAQDAADQIVQERQLNRFTGSGDLLTRVPRMTANDAMQYLSYSAAPTTTLISKATIFASGTSRTVRMIFSREQRIEFLMVIPQVVIKKIDEMHFGRWRFE